jgi:para-nitrobenzyl esterase
MKHHYPISCLLALTTLFAWADEAVRQSPAPTAGASTPTVTQEESTETPEATTSELAGTTWQLVKIMSMDDRIDEPADRTRYTLRFEADGNVRLRVDCNRGTGSWTSQGAGQLGFGPIATTRALCPPGSLFDRYIAQFPWVRSYVLRDGHLFLSTMADGAIIEFEPKPEGDPGAGER